MMDSSLDVTVSLPRLCIIDTRQDDSRLHSVVLSSGLASVDQMNIDLVDPSLLFVQYKTTVSPPRMHLDFKVQQPRLFTEVEFLLEILEYFVPNAIPSKSDTLHCTVISSPHFSATSDVYLSPATRIVACSQDHDVFVFDGQGHSLILPPHSPGTEKMPVIHIGPNKKLIFRNTRIVNFFQLSDCTELCGNSELSLEEDVVKDDTVSDVSSGGSAKVEDAQDVEFDILFEAHNVLAEFRGSSADTALTAKTSVKAIFQTESNRQHLSGKLEALSFSMDEKWADDSAESSLEDSSEGKSSRNNSITLLEPCDVGIDYVVHDSSSEVHLNVSDLNIQVSPMTIHFLLDLQDQMKQPFDLAPPEKPMQSVHQFEKILSFDALPGLCHPYLFGDLELGTPTGSLAIASRLMTNHLLSVFLQLQNHTG